ncbi:hypothetical protein Rctr197k_273 [Virus Rctr197k]|nr:hypothetical protein Rctr197k_273 [Virus Rctr197k]
MDWTNIALLLCAVLHVVCLLRIDFLEKQIGITQDAHLGHAKDMIAWMEQVEHDITKLENR